METSAKTDLLPLKRGGDGFIVLSIANAPTPIYPFPVSFIGDFFSDVRLSYFFLADQTG
jgi:hypothetical protein